MSHDLVKWAIDCRTAKATEKHVLMVMAYRANSVSKECFPSIKSLTEDTQLNRKTIISAIEGLKNQALIRDTGKRKGVTQSVKIYQLSGTNLGTARADKKEQAITVEAVPKTGQVSSPKNGAVPKTVLVPDLDISSPKNGTDSSPKNGTRNKEEEQGRNKEVINIEQPSKKTGLDYSSWPSLPSEQIFKDWKEVRKSKKAMITQTVLDEFGRQLHKAVEMGFTVDECLREACIKNWQGFRADWMKPEAKVSPFSPRQKSDQVQQNKSAFEQVARRYEQ